MFSSSSIYKYPHQAKRQLWELLPGTYAFDRDKHHDMIIKGKKLTQADMHEDYKYRAHGVTIITRRTPTDPEYEPELLQTNQFCFVTAKMDLFVHAEARVFRLQDGEWSFWNTDSSLNVTEKIADLVSAGGYHQPYELKLRAAQQPWVDGKGVNKHLGFDFCMSEEPYWMMHHRLGQKDEVPTVQLTRYTKIPEEREKGWLEWATEGIKVGFVGMKDYVEV